MAESFGKARVGGKVAEHPRCLCRVCLLQYYSCDFQSHMSMVFVFEIWGLLDAWSVHSAIVLYCSFSPNLLKAILGLCRGS